MKSPLVKACVSFLKHVSQFNYKSAPTAQHSIYVKQDKFYGMFHSIILSSAIMDSLVRNELN